MYSYGGVKATLIGMILLLGGTFAYLFDRFESLTGKDTTINMMDVPIDSIVELPQDSIQIFLGTFLGNPSRNYYGDSLPNELSVVWKYKIGGGETNPTGREVEVWHGAGWTGQPLIIEENGIPFIIQGCYDHTLKKINAVTGELVWEYQYDDVLKGTGTVWIDSAAKDPQNRIVILQGARIGLENHLRKDTIPSYRAISYITGKELWRMNVKKGPSFSRDVDGSALILNDTVYIGLENGFFSIFTPGEDHLVEAGDKKFKTILHEYPLFDAQDMIKHGGELVIESSPCRIGDHIYITTGAGHIYGFDLKHKKVDWDLYVGADMNGSPVVTNDSCIIVTLEKQFIKGQGGAMKINPRKLPSQSVVWYFPTEDRDFAGWSGGIVGSVAVNDRYKNEHDRSLACISAMDGNLYLVDHKKINDTISVKGPDGETEYRTPVLLSKNTVGPTISTPIFVEDRICVATYSGIYLFDIIENYQLQQLVSYKGIFESTPTAYGGRIFVASKNGYLYCFGKSQEPNLSSNSDLLQ
jgi:outer membrane protein assembly factor BamB